MRQECLHKRIVPVTESTYYALGIVAVATFWMCEDCGAEVQP